MPNLMLTNWCNNRCPYCFAMDMMVPAKPRQEMTDETFLGILDWLERHDNRQAIHLMGGEPTLHPRFEWIARTLLERDFPIVVFSNLASEQAPDLAEKLSGLPMVSWVMNIGSPSQWTDKQRERIERSLKAIGPQGSISFNIMPDEDDIFRPLELIERFKLNPNIKIGFVLPTITQKNRSLEENEYAVVAAKATALAVEGSKRGVHLQYECGVPTCAFTDLQLGTLWQCGSAVQSGCCSRLDITPEGELIYCLPLSTVAHKHFSEFACYDEAKAWFEAVYAPYRRFGCKIECTSCPHMHPERCNGGCLAKNLIGTENLNINTDIKVEPPYIHY